MFCQYNQIFGDKRVSQIIGGTITIALIIWNIFNWNFIVLEAPHGLLQGFEYVTQNPLSRHAAQRSGARHDRFFSRRLKNLRVSAEPIVLLSLFLIGQFLHYIFCVDTVLLSKSTKSIFDNTKIKII
jgi:hypothetical protein